jgi:predicted enzyme related to lactoylglutathione lyase
MSIRSRRIPVKNRDRAVAFYSTLLGIDLERQAHVLTFEEARDNVPTLLHFKVAQRLDDALAFVWSNGGRVIELPSEVGEREGRALVMDCEGNRVALYTSHAEAPTRHGLIRRIFAGTMFQAS